MIARSRPSNLRRGQTVSAWELLGMRLAHKPQGKRMGLQHGLLAAGDPHEVEDKV